MSQAETEAATPRIGEELRLAREARGLTLGDVSKELLVREDYLNAIETMYANAIPKGYLNGILRTYAGFLGFSTEDTVKKFTAQCGAISQASKREIVGVVPVGTPSHLPRTLATAMAAFVLVCFGGLAVMFLSQNETADSLIGPVEAGVPINGARESLFASVARDEISSQLPLRLVALSPAWLEVRGADGTIFRSRKMATGEVYHPRIGAGWTVTARDGGAFTWHVGDVEIGSLGEIATPVFALSVDSVAAQAQAIASPALAAVGDIKPSR